MKIFQTIQKNFALVGYIPIQEQKNKGTFRKLQFLRMFSPVLSICLVGVYFLFVADSSEEYMYSFFTILIDVGVIVSQASLIFKNDEIFQIIDSIEMVANDSDGQLLFPD